MLTPRAGPLPDTIFYAVHDLYSSSSHLSPRAQAGLGAKEETGVWSCHEAPALRCPSGKGCGREFRGEQVGHPSRVCGGPALFQHCQLPRRVGVQGLHLASGVGALSAGTEGLGGFRGWGLERELGMSSFLLGAREWVGARNGPSAPAHVGTRSGFSILPLSTEVGGDQREGQGRAERELSTVEEQVTCVLQDLSSSR